MCSLQDLAVLAEVVEVGKVGVVWRRMVEGWRRRRWRSRRR